MLVILPPSETKATGGTGAPLDIDGLSLPELAPARRKLTDALRTLAADIPESLRVLGISARQEAEVSRNAELHSAPTMPALRRYTGVLYDALDLAGLSRTEQARADRRLAVASALFGIVHGTDAIPAYRLSGGTTLPGIGTLRSFWRPVLEPVLAERAGLVVDLRSGPYAALARIPDAVTVRVVTRNAAGKRVTVSHHNKAYKGQLARVLGSARKEPANMRDLLAVATAAGIQLDQTGPGELELLTP
ncbi:peroxide stress protein YaaA [Tamaricihabitans halophyticus]|uniref:peroxide stress protein YaaA n=1 Tax=Tamaricihabitans halophyticus TaxID=1262583 RepID=UPI00104522E8|nr:peroxide stress protein YaaA [Tamaricihabitans halophyticus]